MKNKIPIFKKFDMACPNNDFDLLPPLRSKAKWQLELATHKAAYCGAKKYWQPYYINTIEMRSL